MKNSGKQAK